MKTIKIIFYLVFVIQFTFVACTKDDEKRPSKKPTKKPKILKQIPKDLAIDSTQVFDELISSKAEIKRLGLRFDFSDFQPTGVYVKSHSILKLNLNQVKGDRLPKLLVGTYSHGSHWNKQPRTYDLHEGANNINISDAGLVYIKYSTNLAPKGKVEIKFEAGWEHTPFFKLNKTTNSTWKKMLNFFEDAPSVTLVSSKAILVVSYNKAVKYQDENQDALLKSIDNTFLLYNKLSGMDGSSDIHKPMSHKLLMSEYLGGRYYMFAYFHRTAYSSQGVKYILSEKEFNKNGWGPWHEIGHMYQMESWTWNEVGESTVNIYSLAAEKAKGISSSRMKRENKWSDIKKYLALSDINRNFNSKKTSVWTRLGMFYQLQLAFGDDFYVRLHKNVREKKPKFTNDNDKMRIFMLSACQVSQRDLTSFFKKWGFKFDNVNKVYDEIKKMNLPTPTSDLSILTD